MEKSQIEFLFEQRNNVMQGIAEVNLNILNTKAGLKKLEARNESLLDDLQLLTNNLNQLLQQQAEAQEKEQKDVGPVA